MTDTSFSGSIDRLHESAIAATGLQDFGAPDYREGLTHLLAAFDTDTKFTEAGRAFAFGQMVGVLISRLYAEHGFKTYPDAVRAPVRRPIVITGIPRTGTTALHKLLSMDPQFQGLERWLTAAPEPRPPRAEWEANVSYRRMVEQLEAFFAAAPEMRAAHDMVADQVDECLEVLKCSFASNNFGASYYAPQYDKWWLAQDERFAYRWYAKVVRLIGANDPDKIWLLKNPGHIQRLAQFLEVFPDARIIWTHRDPVKAIPSLSSVLLMARKIFEGEAAEPAVIGPREMALWGDAVTQAMPIRAAHESQFIDVDHRRFHAEPMRVVREIYDRFGLTLGPEAEAAMQAWIGRNPTAQHGAHIYDLERFGVRVGEIRERFANYSRTFDLA